MWKTYNFSELVSYFAEANAKLAEKNKAVKALSEEPTTTGEAVEENTEAEILEEHREIR